MKILITSGGTKIPIDKVRDITNMSKGTFGSRIAEEVLKLGHEVVFMKAKGSKTPMQFSLDLFQKSATKDVNLAIDKMVEKVNFFTKYQDVYNEYEYSTFDQYTEMLKYVISAEQPDVIVLAAAVSDYGVENYVDGKIRSNDMFNIKLKQLPKLINRVKEWAKPSAKLVGFKLLVNSKDAELIDASKRSIDENGCDLVVANDLRDIKDDNHIVRLVSKNSLGTYDINTFKSSEHPESPNYLASVIAKKIVTL